MKIKASLPDRKHFKPFKPLGKSERWAYIWEAICTPKLRIYSSVAEPWLTREWLILVRESKGKTSQSLYTNRIDFQLFSELGDSEYDYKAKIIWEVEKGIAHSNRPTLRFYSMPFTNSAGVSVNLMLSIVESKQ